MSRWQCIYEGLIQLGSHNLLNLLDVSEGRAIELIRPLVRESLSGDAGDINQQLLNRFALVCLSNLIEPGDRVAKELCWQLGEQNALAAVAAAVIRPKSLTLNSLPKPTVLKQLDLDAAIERWLPRFSVKQFRHCLEWLARLGCAVYSDLDSAWPEGLNDLEFHAPLTLYSFGDLNLNLEKSSVAIVGSRAASPYGRWVTKDFCEELADAQRPVVSGGAFGIDAIAHQSTMAVGGKTVAVMAGGLDQFYPVGNASLVNEIKTTGAVFAEVPPGFAPTKWRFLQRNRLIAAISSATVVVEAGYRSGSINTANHASELGREVAAVPGPVSSSSSLGCHELIRSGRAKLVSSSKQVLELVESTFQIDDFEERLSPDQTRVLDSIAKSGSSENAISVRAGMSLIQCQITLSFLELEGLAVRNNLKWMRTGRNL